MPRTYLPRATPLVPEIAQRQFTDAEKPDRRDRTVSELCSWSPHLTEDFSDLRLSEITAEQIEE